MSAHLPARFQRRHNDRLLRRLALPARPSLVSRVLLWLISVVR